MRVLRKITNKLGVVDVVVVPDVRCGVCQLVTVNEVSSCFFHETPCNSLLFGMVVFCSTWSGVRVSRVGGKRCRLRWNSSGCDSDSRRRLGDLRVCNACVCIVNHTQSWHEACLRCIASFCRYSYFCIFQRLQPQLQTYFITDSRGVKLIVCLLVCQSLSLSLSLSLPLSFYVFVCSTLAEELKKYHNVTVNWNERTQGRFESIFKDRYQFLAQNDYISNTAVRCGGRPVCYNA